MSISTSLFQGDCLEVLKSIPDNSVDMILADLPYGTTACKWDSVIPIGRLWEQYSRIATDTAAIVLTGNQPFTTSLIASNLAMFKYCWVWVKNRPTGPHHSKNRPMGKHEDIAVFSKAPMGHASQLGARRMQYNPQGASPGDVNVVTAKGSFSRITGPRPNQVGKEYTSQVGLPNTVLYFDKEESHIHPTQKPVALMEYLVRTYTIEGQVVLDNVMGSGTTGVACVQSGRNFVGIELNEAYFQLASDRISKAKENL